MENFDTLLEALSEIVPHKWYDILFNKHLNDSVVIGVNDVETANS